MENSYQCHFTLISRDGLSWNRWNTVSLQSSRVDQKTEHKDNNPFYCCAHLDQHITTAARKCHSTAESSLQEVNHYVRSNCCRWGLAFCNDTLMATAGFFAFFLHINLRNYVHCHQPNLKARDEIEGICCLIRPGWKMKAALCPNVWRSVNKTERAVGLGSRQHPKAEMIEMNR